MEYMEPDVRYPKKAHTFITDALVNSERDDIRIEYDNDSDDNHYNDNDDNNN